MAKFPDRLRSIMRSRRMTQSDFAKLIDVSPGTLSAYLKEDDRRKVPTLDTIERIAHILNVSIGWLCGEDAADNTPKTYADVIGYLVKICESDTEYPCCAFANIESMGGQDSNYAGITTSDPTIVEFMVGYKKVTDLLDEHTIDREIYDAWVQKKLKDYEKRPLDGLPF